MTQNGLPTGFTFEMLVKSIHQTHKQLATQAGRAVNISLTLRNWVIGQYIREYEQNGADRAEYGRNLVQKLSEELKLSGVVKYHPRELRRCRAFYSTYPEIRGTLPPETIKLLPASLESKSPKEDMPGKWGTLSPDLTTPPGRLVSNLSFSHFAELIEVEDPLERAFYEVECIRGNWSVRELRRQIASLYFQRSGLSRNKRKLAELVESSADVSEPALAIRDPYVFEFLGLKPSEVMSESMLEDRLLDNLQEFLLELGEGFCFEARQKRILIGDTYNFVDIVFYHRILKCHVLVELKISEFSHENIGQLNTYISWYKRNVMAEGDNPPVGILLCTRNDRALVEYALAGMDNKLFVSKYKLELPRKEVMERFIEEQMAEAGK